MKGRAIDGNSKPSPGLTRWVFVRHSFPIPDLGLLQSRWLDPLVEQVQYMDIQDIERSAGCGRDIFLSVDRGLNINGYNREIGKESA